MSTLVVCYHLLAASRGVEYFSSTDHETVRTTAVTAALKSCKTEKLDSTIDSSILEGLDCDTHRTILQGKET
jgi:hypothetical protein